MGAHVAGQLVKAMLRRRIHVDGARVLVMGLTFKEDCPDLRNTRVVDVVRELSEYGVVVDVYDPAADPAEAQHEYGISLITEPQTGAYDAIILAVAHAAFREMTSKALHALGRSDHVLYDLKHVLPASESDMRL